MTEPNMSLGPTKLRDLLLCVIGVGLPVWLVVRINYASLPALPSLASAVLFLLAIVEGIISVVIRIRLSNKGIGHSKGRLHPIVVARAAILAKASAIVGALSLGFWGGMSIYLLQRRSELVAAADDFPEAMGGVVGSVLLIGISLWLEYCCRTPDDPEVEPAG